VANERMAMDHRGEHRHSMADHLGRGLAGCAEPLLADGRVTVPVGGGEVDHGYTGGMDTTPKRPWYGLHWVTWIVVVVVAGGLVNSEFEKHFGIGTYSAGYTDLTYFGWPRAHLEFVESGRFVGPGTKLPSSFKYHWRWPVLALNVLACVVIVGSTMWVAESWIRSSNRLQFKLQALLLFTGVVRCSAWLASVVHVTIMYEALHPRLNFSFNC
jgi:hypothetical protein